MTGDAAAGVAPAATARKRRIMLAVVVCGFALVLGLAIVKSNRQLHQHQQPSSDIVSPSLPQAAAVDKASVNTTDTTAVQSSTIIASTSAGSASSATNTGPVASAVGNLWSSLTSAFDANNINKQGITGPDLGTTDGSEISFISIPFCTPRNTTQLEILVEESVCPVITLLPNTTYVLDHYITVSRPVTIVGRPLGMPLIDGHGTFRIFMVLPGGRLDLRYVRLYKGRARPVVPNMLYVLQGAIVVGISKNIRATTLILGGGVYVEGGIFRATGCVYTTWRPGIIYRETYFIGNEFLVMTGDVFITGCIFSMVQVFSNTIGVGGFVFNVAGVVALTGCIFNSNTVFLSAIGMGYVCFNQGAVILTGNINNLQAAFAGFWGGGLGAWNGGGVLTMTGMLSNAEIIMSAGGGLGFQAGCGGGVVIRTGIVQSIHGAAAFGCGVGHSQFLGSGVLVFTNVVLTRTNMLVVFFGIGGYLYVGAGSATITNTVAGVVTGIGTTAAAGGGSMILAGWLVRTNNLILGISMIVAIFGQGTDLMVVSGGAVLVRNRVVTRRPALIYATPGIFGVWIAGNGIFFNPGMDKVVVATKAGQWKGFNNVTSKGMAKFSHMSWRFIPRKVRLKKGVTLEPNPEPVTGEPPPSPTSPKDAAYYIGVPFFGIRRRARGRRLLDAESSSEGITNNPSGGLLLPSTSMPSLTTQTMKLPSANLIAQAVGQLLTLDDAAASSASSYAGLFGGSSTSFGYVEMGAVLDKDEDEAPLPLTTYFTTVGENGQEQQQQIQQSSYFFVGDDEDSLGSCEACDIEQETLFDGPGGTKCLIRDTCEEEEKVQEDGQSGGFGNGLLQQMWMTGLGEDPANTSMAVLDLRVTASSILPSSSPSTPQEKTSSRLLSGSSVLSSHILTALSETIQALGLSPRHHLRVVAVKTDPLMKKYQEAEMDERRHHRERLRALVNKPGFIVGEDDEGGQDEGEKEGIFLFRAYFLSDWANVTNALSRTLAANAKLLTATLQSQRQQQQQQGQQMGEEGGLGGIESVQVLREMNYFVPGSGTGLLLTPTTSSSPGSSPSFSSSSTFSTPSLTSLFDGIVDGGSSWQKGKLMTMSGWEEDRIPSAMLYTTFISAPFRNSTMRSSSYNHTGDGSTVYYEEDPASALAQEVKVGETYTLVMHSFPPSQLLTISLVPETGLGMDLALIASTVEEEGEDGGQRWSWRPNSLIRSKFGQEGDFFIEVASQNKDAFAYSQAFTLKY
ncbi:pectin lyase fold virulence factor [Nannochloropsis oceanica]